MHYVTSLIQILKYGGTRSIQNMNGFLIAILNMQGGKYEDHRSHLLWMIRSYLFLIWDVERVVIWASGNLRRRRLISTLVWTLPISLLNRRETGTILCDLVVASVAVDHPRRHYSMASSSRLSKLTALRDRGGNNADRGRRPSEEMSLEGVPN